MADNVFELTSFKTITFESYSGSTSMDHFEFFQDHLEEEWNSKKLFQDHP